MIINNNKISINIKYTITRLYLYDTLLINIRKYE